uniref:AlNc14C579G12205 protein n=1 Tax=Albugo laibachii Nc14 TaxID=890382 RepID=F0X1B5_9STRA|nr:AlNc14C579G12205 [Albugo laibachii Nc14]|eukprot:CCA27590.1 AlNc14C579G12205 [Albugo laibachii Nc14]
MRASFSSRIAGSKNTRRGTAAEAVLFMVSVEAYKSALSHLLTQNKTLVTIPPKRQEENAGQRKREVATLTQGQRRREGEIGVFCEPKGLGEHDNLQQLSVQFHIYYARTNSSASTRQLVDSKVPVHEE